MYVSNLKLQNWKNFRQVEVKLRNRMFLAGPNASGKSNFMDVFRFLRDIVKAGGGLQQAVQDRGGLSKIRCLAARQEPDIEIEVDLSEHDTGEGEPLWRYAIGIMQEPRGRRQPLIRYERIWKQGKLILDRPDSHDEQDSLRRTQTHLEQISANENFRKIADFFNSVLYLHLVPQLVRNPEAFSGPNLSGDPFGRNFLERVARTNEKTRKARLRKIEEALVKAVPQLKHLTDIKDEAGIPHLEAVYEHWRPRGAKQREDQFSDGTLRLIAFLWSLMETDNLLLMEEPELSLNASIVRQLPSIIYRFQKKKQRQVILSTHSAELLDNKGIDGSEVLILTPALEGTEVKVASDIEEVKLLLEGGLSVAEAVLPRTEPKTIQQQGLLFEP
jgi:predicted ATPase